MKETKPKKWVYLLTGIMHPINDVYPFTELILSESIEEINLQHIGVRIKRVFLTEKDRIEKPYFRGEYKDRFIFYINDGIRDDNLAQSFADAVMFSLALLEDVTVEDIPRAIAIPQDVIKKGIAPLMSLLGG